MRTLYPFCTLLCLICLGCGTTTLNLQQPKISAPDYKRGGVISLQVDDRRQNKDTIGEMKGGFGNRLGNIVLKQDLSGSLARIFAEALEACGYTVRNGAPVTLHAEIREFVVFGNGWTQGAREKIRLILRDKSSEPVWDRLVTGEDGGMSVGVGSYEKSMNVALERLIADATEEFTSDLFYRFVLAGAKSQGSEH